MSRSIGIRAVLLHNDPVRFRIRYPRRSSLVFHLSTLSQSTPSSSWRTLIFQAGCGKTLWACLNFTGRTSGITGIHHAEYSKRLFSKAAANYHLIKGGWDDPNCASSQFPMSFSRVAWSILDCARLTSTFLSCAFHEQEDGQATLPILLRPRVARPRGTYRVIPLAGRIFSILTKESIKVSASEWARRWNGSARLLAPPVSS